jgi:uridine kinase
MITPRERVLGRIADHLCERRPGHPLRVAVDGITASGKTTLARELTAAVASMGRPAAHLTMDGFHNPRVVRHRLGRDSADGYYTDAYDFTSFERLVLEPLGPGGDRKYRERIIDLRSDTPLSEPPVEAPEDMILIVDGSFLQRELTWDEVVFVDTPFEVARDRGTRRDTELLGGLEQAGRAFDQRYHAAGRRYLTEVGPADRATVVLGNADVANPVLIRIG